MQINNERGLTLVELLAVLTIGSLILLFIAGTHLFVQKQYHSQAEQSNQLTDEIQALKVITKKVRMTKGEIVVNSFNHSIEFPDGEVYQFDRESKTIYRNNIPFTNGVETFHARKETISDRDGTTNSVIRLTINNYETEIVIRGSE